MLVFGLSKRQIEIMKHVADGKTDKQIAEALELKENTIGTHMTSIYKRMDVKNRVQAVNAAREAGLL